MTAPKKPSAAADRDAAARTLATARRKLTQANEIAKAGAQPVLTDTQAAIVLLTEEATTLEALAKAHSDRMLCLASDAVSPVGEWPSLVKAARRQSAKR